MPWSGNKAPNQTGEDGQALALWMEDELERFANEQIDNLQAVDLRPVYNEPIRPRSGMLAYADGTKWNPGSGEGLYVRNSANVWVPLSSIPSGYEEGTWTPGITFATIGNLVVVYSGQNGYYVRIGKLVFAFFTISTSTFTWTTSSGLMSITGLPFTVADVLTGAVGIKSGALDFQGITKAGYTQFAINANTSTTTLSAIGSGSGVARSNVVAADMPSGGSVILRGTGIFVKT